MYARLPVLYVPPGEEALARINAANPFELTRTDLLEAGPPLFSFAQGLAAWDESDPSQIEAMLEYIALEGKNRPGYPGSEREMATWPSLTNDDVHAAARSFYAKRKIEFR